MQSVQYARSAGGKQAPNMRSFLVAASMTIYAGDLVVLADGGTGGNRVRKLTATDISNHYTETSLKGILGVAANTVITNASGHAVTQPAPSGVAGGAYPIFPIPTTPAGMQVDPDTGVAKLRVILADDDTIFRIRMQGASNAAVTFNQDYIGEGTGFQVYNTNDFAANVAATGTDIAAVIVGVSETDPNFNVSSAVCWGFVRIKPTYQQLMTGLTYN